MQALGCILYLLCFKQHPFEEGAKLQIVNGKYSIPQNDVKYTVYHDLIRTFLHSVSVLYCHLHQTETSKHNVHVDTVQRNVTVVGILAVLLVSCVK